jgi:hypothetical protein
VGFVMADWVVTFTIKVGVSGQYALSENIAESTALNLLESVGFTPTALTDASLALSDEMTQTEILDADIKVDTKWLS